MLKDNTIHSNTKDSFTKISLVRGALSTAGLKNLLDGHRPMPISNELTNIDGFTKRRQIQKSLNDEVSGTMTVVKILLKDDDVYYRDYDCGRLFQAVMEIFGKSLHYLVPHEIGRSDGIAVYNKIMEHLNGQSGRDADVARENVNE